MKNIHPQSNTYELLRQELVRLSQSPPKRYHGILPLGFGRILRPEERHARMNDLRMRLDVAPLSADERLYDDRLTAAVIKFQRDAGLHGDGIIGSQTLKALNRTKVDQMMQVIANMERLRWVDEARPDKFVVVNIPSATLWAIDNGKVEFEMPVIVGRPGRATESFITGIKGVRFNPTWTVPPTIKYVDMLPKLKNNPEYFADKGIEIFTGYGKGAQTLDPESVDWDDMSRQELRSLRMVQSPGAHNALGRVRVLMPNRFNIYLHDTNSPELFNKPARAVSSGCVRLKDPLKMASFIMRDEQGWNDPKMTRILDAGKTSDHHVSEAIPVYILYYTNWVDQQGRIVYGTDIYNQDQALIKKLANIDGFAIPGHTMVAKGKSALSKLASVN